MNIKGRIKHIGDLLTFSSGFQKRELVITTQEQYPQDILIEFLKDKTDILSALKKGDEVNVYINLQGREWINPEGVAKYFNTIVGWKVETLAQSSEPAQNNNQNEPDDLPF